MIGLILDFVLGYLLLFGKIPTWIWDLFWHNWAGYFWRNAPYPDDRWLRRAGALLLVHGVVTLIDLGFNVGPGIEWIAMPVALGIAICIVLAFVIPWAQPFRKDDRTRRWNETVYGRKNDH